MKRIDGHDFDEISRGLSFLTNNNISPSVLIADTVKGKGVSFMEDQPESHYWGGLTDDQMQLMLKELKV